MSRGLGDVYKRQSTLPLGFVHVSFIVVPETPSPHYQYFLSSFFAFVQNFYLQTHLALSMLQALNQRFLLGSLGLLPSSKPAARDLRHQRVLRRWEMYQRRVLRGYAQLSCCD